MYCQASRDPALNVRGQTHQSIILFKLMALLSSPKKLDVAIIYKNNVQGMLLEWQMIFRVQIWCCPSSLPWPFLQ